MNCPRCGYEQLSAGAAPCPSCGAVLDRHAAERRTVEIDVNQRVEQNLGSVIGVKTEAIHGDVYADEVLHVQLYLLSGIGRGESWRRFLSETTPPYKYLAPYMARDRALFHGREKQIRTALLRIAGQPMLTAYGPAGVGKTSLFAAGVIPDLMLNGALVVRVEEYRQPLEQTIREALAGSGEQIALAFPTERTLPALVHAVVRQTDGTMVLILDHVERLSEPNSGDGDEARLALELAGALRAVDPDYLRVVVVVDSLDRLGPLPEQLPGLLSHPLRVKPLTCQEAELAIKEPLAELHRRGAATLVSYYRDFVEAELVPHLDRLSPADKDYVHPPHLQIVCHELYEKAAARHPEPVPIDHELYSSLRGAEGILFTYVDEALEGFGEQQELAREILEAMAFARLGPQVAPDQLQLNGATVEQKLAVMDRLVKAELLHLTSANGRPHYAFSSPVVKESVRKQAPPEKRKRYDPEDDLERAWSAWVVHRRLARRSQLHYLAEADDYLSPWPDQVLLLLRSALARHQTVDPWLRRIRDEGEALISQLDESVELDAWQGERSVDHARRLLGLAEEEDGYELSPRPEPEDGFGQVAWSAVRHRDPNTRQTAALALTGTEKDPRNALTPLDNALRALGGRWQRWRRRVELLGVLADADPSIARANKGLRAVDRGGIWLWRFWRRVRADWTHIAALAVGGALGAGGGLGLLRMVIALLARDALWGIHFQTYLFQGFWLGLMLCLGMTLSDAFLLRPVGAAGAGADGKAVSSKQALTVALGTLFFGIAHMLQGLMTNLFLLAPLPLFSLGLLFGLGLSLALHRQPEAGWRLGFGRWFLYLGVAAAMAVLTQVLFGLATGIGVGITIAWTRNTYASYGWPPVLGLLDAAIVGAVLVAGIASGLVIADHTFRTWRDRAVRAGD
jgi:hypothetical protein